MTIASQVDAQTMAVLLAVIHSVGGLVLARLCLRRAPIAAPLRRQIVNQLV